MPRTGTERTTSCARRGIGSQLKTIVSVERVDEACCKSAAAGVQRGGALHGNHPRGARTPCTLYRVLIRTQTENNGQCQMSHA